MGTPLVTGTSVREGDLPKGWDQQSEGRCWLWRDGPNPAGDSRMELTAQRGGLEGLGGWRPRPLCIAHGLPGVRHAAHEGGGLGGAGPHRLCPTLAEEPCHGGLVGEAEAALVLRRGQVRPGNAVPVPIPIPVPSHPGQLTRKWASCREIWMKASGLVRHFLISPFPKSENWKQQKSTSSASALARRYELSMVAQHCGEVQPWWMGLTAPNPGPPPPPPSPGAGGHQRLSPSPEHSQGHRCTDAVGHWGGWGAESPPQCCGVQGDPESLPAGPGWGVRPTSWEMSHWSRWGGASRVLGSPRQCPPSV